MPEPVAARAEGARLMDSSVVLFEPREHPAKLRQLLLDRQRNVVIQAQLRDADVHNRVVDLLEPMPVTAVFPVEEDGNSIRFRVELDIQNRRLVVISKDLPGQADLSQPIPEARAFFDHSWRAPIDARHQLE